MFHIKNIKEGPFMTVFGALLILLGVYLLFRKDGVETPSVLLIVLGAGAMGLKDPRVPPSATPLLLIALLCLTGCVTYNKCMDKFGVIRKDSVKVFVKIPVFIHTQAVSPADSLQDHFDIDSMLSMFDTLRQTSASQRTQIEFWKDKYSRALHYKVKVKPDTIKLIVKDTVRAEVNCPPCVVFDPLKDAPWYSVKALWNKFQLFAAWAVLGGLFLFGLYVKLKK